MYHIHHQRIIAKRVSCLFQKEILTRTLCLWDIPNWNLKSSWERVKLKSPRAPWPVAITPRNFFPSAVNLVHSCAFNEDIMIRALQSIHVSSKRIEMKSSKWDHNHAVSERGQLWSHLAFVSILAKTCGVLLSPPSKFSFGGHKILESGYRIYWEGNVPVTGFGHHSVRLASRSFSSTFSTSISIFSTRSTEYCRML